MEWLLKLLFFLTLFSTLQISCNSLKFSHSVEKRDAMQQSVKLDTLVCVEDYEAAAANILNENALLYYKSGSDEEITLRDNMLAFKRIIIRPRVLVDLSNRSTSTMVLGKPVSFPLGVSPTAMQKLATPEGEIANSKAAAAVGTIYILSTLSTISLEDVMAASPHGRKWFQLYVYKNRTLSASLVKRAEAVGYEAIVLTVDTPYFGKRRANLRTKFYLPSDMRLANFDDEIGSVVGNPDGGSGLDQLNKLLDRLTWDDIKWLKSVTTLPVYVKGILTPEDAELAIEYGADGIMVSNHGARQLDTVLSTIDALPEISKRVAGRCDVFLDGGVRTGTDIFKALAYGAKMVFTGRPLLWGLAVNGEEGSKTVLNILKDEFDLTMALAGVQNVEQITEKYVGSSVSPQPR